MGKKQHVEIFLANINKDRSDIHLRPSAMKDCTQLLLYCGGGYPVTEPAICFLISIQSDSYSCPSLRATALKQFSPMCTREIHKDVYCGTTYTIKINENNLSIFNKRRDK